MNKYTIFILSLLVLAWGAYYFHTQKISHSELQKLQIENELLQDENKSLEDLVDVLEDNIDPISQEIESDSIETILEENTIEESPVVVSNEVETSSFSVYFINTVNNPWLSDCTLVESVDRVIPYTQSIATAAINSLIAGPTSMELQSGYYQVTPSTATLNSISISSGVAYVDVDAEFFAVGGSCGTANAVTSLRNTLLQFSTISDIEITVDGIDWSVFAQNLI